MAKSKTPAPTPVAGFNETTFKKLAADMTSGRIPLTRMQISDPETVGLRANISKTGNTYYHVSYSIDDKRPQIKVGDASDGQEYITLDTARHRARVIIALAERGIDIQEGLYKRLMFEIDRDGIDWRPIPTLPAKKSGAALPPLPDPRKGRAGRKNHLA